MPKDGPSIVSNSTAATFGNSPQKTGEPIDRLEIYSGKGLEFDGVSDYITANPDFLVNSTATTAMTVAVWVNVDDISSNQDVIASFDTNENSKFLSNYNGSITFTMYNNDYSDILGQKTDDAVLIEGQWHRIVATYDGSQTDAGFKIYMDGALIASSASNSIFSANLTTDLTIGRTNRSGGTSDFAGKMSDFQVWDTVWSLADVTYDYLNPEKLITSQNPVNHLPSNLRVWYPMNDTGVTHPQTVVFDAAGTNNTTKAHGTTTFLGDDKLGGNGGFDATSNWSVVSGSVGTEWTINDSSNSKAVHNTSNANTLRYTGSSGDLVNGNTYQVDFTIADRTAGSLTFALGGAAASSSQTASGSIELAAGGTSNRIIDINPTSDFDGSIDSVTVKEVGIATGWTDADQQQYIPQTGFMDGCIKSFAGDGVFSNTVPSLSYPFSLSCWIYKGDDAAYGVYLVDKDAANIFFGIALGSDDKVYLQASNTSVKNTNSNSTYTNQWVHVVAVFESATDRNLYINGSQNTDNENNDSVTYENIDRISIGYLGDSSPVLSGAETIVDEIAIFNKSLNADFSLSLGGSEIGLLYNSGQPHDLVEYSKTIKSSSNLVGYWKNNNLNSEGKWKDQSTNSNNCTINGTPDHIFFQQGATANLCTQGYSNNIVHPSKGAIHFLGQEYAAFPGERIINLDGDFTIEFWFKKTQLHVGSGLIDNMLFGSGTNQIRIPSTVIDGKMSAIYYRDGGVNSSFSIHSDNRKSIYEWSHVALVKEQGTIKPYIDAVGTGNGTLSSTGQMQIKLIGAYSVAAGQMYKGFLDDLRIYDKALSLAEVTKNYKNGKSQHKNS